MKKNITYLLGAGASAQAMPTVAELPLALEVMHNYFIYLKDYKAELLYHRKIINRIIETIEALCVLVRSHASIDTLFRKIDIAELNYIQVDISNKPKCRFYSYELISVYDLLLIFCEYSFYLDKDFQKQYKKTIRTEHGGSIENPAWTYIKSKIDTDLRYDAFLATIIEKENKKIKLPENIRIISWNYDLHLERSILNFTTFNQWSIASNYLEICDVIQPNKTYKTFKLNGSSYSYSNKSEQCFNIKIGNIYAKGIYEGLIKPFLENVEIKDDYNDYFLNHSLFFNWDDNSAVRDKCFESITNTEILVVIGYTFPTFNRNTDRKLYESMPKLEKVYIQAPPNSINDIKISFQSLLLEGENIETDEIFTSINPKNTSRYKGRLPIRIEPQNDKWYFMKIVGIENINQFFIPPEF